MKEGGGGANHNQALSVKMRNLCLFGLARPLDWVSQGYPWGFAGVERVRRGTVRLELF